MNRIKKGILLHEGSNSNIYKVQNKETTEQLVMKTLKKKYTSWMKIISMREIDCLRRVTNPAIVKLKEVIKDGDRLNLILEEMDCNLHHFLHQIEEKGKKVPENLIKCIIFQIASGLARLHSDNFVHRDIKPENILLTTVTAKISDFSSCRKINNKEPLTEYITARWYRAPEIQIKNKYTIGCDIWSLGCIMAEMYTGKPLFPGHSEIDQLSLLNKFFGTKALNNWPEFAEFILTEQIVLPNVPETTIGTKITNCSHEGLLVLNEMLQFNPANRVDAVGILTHPFFVGYIPRYIKDKYGKELLDDKEKLLSFKKDKN